MATVKEVPMAQTAQRRNRPYAPRLSPQQRREQLLDIVLDVIDTEGVGSVSMDAVARRAGVTRPVVYGQFTDANAMLRACLDREEQRALAQILDAMPADGADTAEAFHRLFDTYLTAVADAPQRWRSIFMIAPSWTPTLSRSIARIRARMVLDSEVALRKSRAGGRQADRELLAHHLVAALWESGRLLLVAPDEYSHKRLLRSLDAMFVALTQR
ncbi:TetR/AcrR family transcriptional regulator [Mycobacterium sp. ACS1612]|uniref:TetR/AcrR family transcriptional regulator n=1 Tax=Mycobacterium sp. ACS1612 TaxID=1834117 RepID=UPI0018D2DF5C|nr:TetR/AcrR family transcriptional regulator [Mycobacterium sp. ACS1612]